MVEHLLKLGFTKVSDRYCNVNRYEKSDDNYFSVTLTEDGKNTLYGVFLFDQRNPGIWRKKKFEGNIPFEDLMVIMDKNQIPPVYVREFPYV